MKILLIADVSIAQVIGGAERVIFEQSTRLAGRGHDVHLLTRRLRNHKRSHAVIRGVNEWRYNSDIQKNAVSFLYKTFNNSRKLFEALHKEHTFDLVNIYQPFSALGPIYSPLGQGLRKIYTCFSFSFEEFISRNSPKGGLLDKFVYRLNAQTRRWIEERALKSCAEIVVLSQFTRDKLWEVYRLDHGHVSIVPGGIDLIKFKPAFAKQQIRRQLNLPEEKVILFTVRNLVPRMGLENLIKAIKKIIHQAPDIYLVIGGQGHLKQELQVLIQDLGLEAWVSLAGFIPESLLPDYYRMADLFVLPTRELEGFGLVTLEAMASGIPVIGTPVGGTREIIEKFNASYLFRDIDPDSMADLIVKKYRQVKEHPRKWQAISDSCREFIESNYSWEKNVDSMEELFCSN